MFLAASVALQQDLYSAQEGGEVQVCAVISNVPAGDLECHVVANLSASDGNAGKWWYLDFCSVVRISCIFMLSRDREGLLGERVAKKSPEHVGCEFSC